ncbi:phosphatidylserine synthase [Favolaschia claudopus]|uniref:Phosphatidylserine synthase n=1 Tax=Favolaschia claudopus TaxID=2862362 RepID=A0AAW0ANQ8_9AGAR
MRNFFQRKPESQPTAVWLPPQDPSRQPVPPAPWLPNQPQTTARRAPETRRSASAAPTSTTYKFATLPNDTGYHYPASPFPLPQPTPVQPYSSQYYAAPQPIPPERPDSRLGHVPYPNPQYPPAPPPSQATVSKRREEKTRDVNGRSTTPTVAKPYSSSSKNDDANRMPRRSSSSSMREQTSVEPRKTKHRSKDRPESRKEESQVKPVYAEKRRDRSSRKEAARDGKSRRDSRYEEGDSSDSSIQRPATSKGLRSRVEGGKSSSMGPALRTGIPIQPTSTSSSSGRHTPQIARLPVYLPANQARSHRLNEDLPGPSGSDTDHGTLNRARNQSQGSTQPKFKQTGKSSGESSTFPLFSKRSKDVKEVKESTSFWPFSRSRSSQKLPQHSSTMHNISAKKIRADPTLSRFPVDDRTPERPEYRRHASDTAISSRPEPPARRPTVPLESRPQTDVPSSSSRPLIFATQTTESSSRVAQPLQHPSLEPRSHSASAPPAAVAGIQASQPTSASRQDPPSQPTVQGPGLPAAMMMRQETRNTASLPPLYGPPISRPPDYPRGPDRSPRVSQLVAGFEARAAETQTQVPSKSQPTPSRREVTQQPSIPPIYATPQQTNQSHRNGQASASTRQNLVASQPPPRVRTTSDASVRPLADTSNVQTRPIINEPNVLKSALRDLLSDKPTVSRSEERPRKPSEPRQNQTSFPAPVYPIQVPSQSQSSSQPPVQVAVPTSSSRPKSSSKGDAPPEVVSARRADASQSESRSGANRVRDEPRDSTNHRSSRPKREKDVIAVMKTPSKDSSRHTSTPSPVVTHQSRSNDRSSPSQPSPSRSQPQPELQVAGKQVPSLVPSNVPPSSSHVHVETQSQRDARPPATKYHYSRDISANASAHAPPSSSAEQSQLPASMPNVRHPPPAAPSPNAVPPPGPGGSQFARSHTPSSNRPPDSSDRRRRSMNQASSEESILKTPSSLAHSILPPLQPSVSRTSVPASTSSETRKKGLFGIFRSREGPQPGHDFPLERVYPSSDNEAHLLSTPQRKLKSKIPPPIAVPNPAIPIADRKSPNSRVFTPFRYLSNKRNRRVSTASMDAVDGTAANTVMGSPTASMQSSQIPPHSPPRRDPRLATQDWRNQEETHTLARAQAARGGKVRRVRPGVVFDVAEDPAEETRRSKLTRSKKPRPRTENDQTPATDSSDA